MKLFLFIAVLSLCPALMRGQTYPSAVTVQFTGDHSPYLDEYTDPVTPRLKVMIMFTDFSEAYWNFSLKVKITGPNGLTLESKAENRPKEPFSIVPGHPYTVQGSDLSFCLDLQQMTIAGIDPVALQKTQRLPEGYYTFAFEAADFVTGRSLSRPGSATAYLSLNDPPSIVNPAIGGLVNASAAQTVLFQWMLPSFVNTHSEGIKYNIDLYEVNSTWNNPANALVNHQVIPIWRSPDITKTTYLYTMSEPLLEKGKRYVFTVQAVAYGSRPRFRNDGYSSVGWFQFGYPENDTIDVIHPLEGFQYRIKTPSTFQWKRPRLARPDQPVAYTIRICAIQTSQDAEDALSENQVFYEQTYLPTLNETTEKTIPVTFWALIARMTPYAWQVLARSGDQIVARSKPSTFIGPPAIESFIAGGFLMTVTQLSTYNALTGQITGTAETVIQQNKDPVQVRFSNVGISSIGGDEWVMVSGAIHDGIEGVVYELSPDSNHANGKAWFQAEQIYVNSAAFELGGHIHWNLPHATYSGVAEELISANCHLRLTYGSYQLNNRDPVELWDTRTFQLLEPAGFGLKLDKGSSVDVVMSTFLLHLKGSIRLPGSVHGVGGKMAVLNFDAAQDVNYIQCKTDQAESISLFGASAVVFTPSRYCIDLSEATSPVSSSKVDKSWKGIWIQDAEVKPGTQVDESGQITIRNADGDSVSFNNAGNQFFLIDQNGISAQFTCNAGLHDSICFNEFHLRNATWNFHIDESRILQNYLDGLIHIPILDTVRTFPVHVPIEEHGFGEGYLSSALSNSQFTFNPYSTDQKIILTIRRAYFHLHRLELETDLSWVHLNLSINGVQGLCAWGNGDIGFDMPNGVSPLSTQVNGVHAGIPINVTSLGCGRSGNVYAIGAKADLQLGEDISGDAGPPIIQAYSICRNALLSGTFAAQSLSNIPQPSSSTVSAQTSNYTSQVATQMKALEVLPGVTPGDTTLFLSGGAVSTSTAPFISGNIHQSLQQLIDVILKLRPFIKKSGISDREWLMLERLKSSLENDVVKRTTSVNSTDVLNFILNKVFEGMADRVSSPVQDLSDKTIRRIRNTISKSVIQPVHQKTDELLTSVFQKIGRQILAQMGEQYRQAVAEALNTVQRSLINGINNSVSGSFETHITSKLTGFIEKGVTLRVSRFLRKEILKAGHELITNGANADLRLQDLVRDARELMTEVADTVEHVVMEINGKNFVRCAESLVEDAIEKINWNQIASQVMNELIARGISETVIKGIEQYVGSAAGNFAKGVLNNVKFDFSNLGEKVKKGELGKIVQFDPTNIYIESPVADVRGQLKFTHGDPTYGDSWQGNVMVRVKVPKKDNPVECDAYFITGRTTGSTPFAYWAASVTVSGLHVPMSPTSLVLDRIEGHLFSRMKRNENRIVPDASNHFGVGCRFGFYDQPSNGKMYTLDVGADARFDDGGYAIELNGDASVLNFRQSNGRYTGPGFITATASVGYYDTEGSRRIAALLHSQLNTSPVLCGGGDAGMDLRTPSNWKVWVGTQTSPVSLKVLCKDFISTQAYLELNQSGVAAALRMNVDLEARSPWVSVSNFRMRGHASFECGFNISTSVNWDPDFVINEASIAAWVNAELGIDYEISGTRNSFTIAGVGLAGSLRYISQPESEVHGTLSGHVTVLNCSLDLETEVHYSLSQQKFISN